MAINAFKIFDENKKNIMSDADYAADSQRINGVSAGVARSALHNKQAHQSSLMAAAIGQFLANRGLNANEDFNDLLNALEVYFLSLVPKFRTVCGKALSADISLTAEHVGAIPATWLPIMTKAIRQNVINILRLKLQQSLSASDIDAWSDLLADGTRINAAASLNHMVSDGSLKVGKMEQLEKTYSYNFGYSAAWQKVAQTFRTRGALSLKKITVCIGKTGDPQDNIHAYLYATSGGKPTTQLYQAANTIPGPSVSAGSNNNYDFNFSNAQLEANTLYAIVLTTDGGASNSSYYYALGSNDDSAYPYGAAYVSGGEWYTPEGHSPIDLYFSISYESASAVWNAVKATEPLKYVAISADQTKGAGTITWYISDDGTNWVKITSLDTMQEVNFDSPNVHLKCELTGDASVQDVAWGGY